MYFTKGKQRAFELLMQQKPGFDRYQSGCAGDDEDCGTCRFYPPGWKYEFLRFQRVSLLPRQKDAENARQHGQIDGQKPLCPCGFADAKTAKGILQYQNSRKRLSNCPRIPREEVRKYGSFQSGAKYGIYRYEQPPLAKQELSLKGKGLVVANAFAARRLGLYPCGLSHINREKIDAIREAVKELEKAGYIVRSRGARRKGTLAGRRLRHIRAAAAARAGSSYQRRTAAYMDLPTLENPTLDNPTLEKPTQEKPTLENPTQLNKIY